MSEELQFGMGLDTGPFARGMRSAKEMAKEIGGEIRNSLNDFGKAALAPFTAIASVEGLRKVLEFGEGIERGAKIAGVSTDFYQTLGAAMRQTGGDAEIGSKGMEKLTALIGDAREGNTEAITTFSRLGISLNDTNGAAKDTESIMREVSDKMHMASSAEERAAVATDLFGKKLGLELVPALEGGSAALDKFGASASSLSEKDLKTLADMNKTMNESANTAEVWTGKLIGAFSEVSAVLGALSTGKGGLDNYLNGIARDTVNADKAKRLADAAAQQAADVADLDKIVDLMGQVDKQKEDAASKQMTKQERLNDLTTQKLELQHEIDAAGEGTIDGLQKQIELGKIDVDIQKTKKEIAKEAADDAKKAKQHQHEIDQASLEVAKTGDALSEAQNRRSELSLSDLTSSKFRFSGTLGEDQQKAFQIKNLESQGEWNRQHGFLDDAKARFSAADAIRNTLSSNVPESERHPFKNLQESAKEAADHLATIVDNISDDGLMVDVQNIELDD